MDRAKDLEFRPAELREVGVISQILSEAAEWARARGIERWWPVPFPEEWVRPGIERGEVWVALDRGTIVGTLSLTFADLQMWGEQPPVAGYVHRLATRRERVHRGRGAQLLDSAADEVRRAGRTKLRLDCMAANASLVAYYREHGFREVGRVQGKVPGSDQPSVLWERDIR